MLLACLAALSALAPASARADYLLSYEVTTNEDTPDITNIVIYQTGPTGGSLTYPFSAGGFGATTLINNPFPVPTVPEGAFQFGLVKGLPTDDGIEVEHAVLMMNQAAAILSNGVDYSEIFPFTSESDLITAIKNATESTDPVTQNQGISALFSFALNDAQNAFLGGQVLPIYFTPGSAFSVIAFSSGQTIGSGQTLVTVSAVPEPSSLVLLALGATASGLLLRRRLRFIDQPKRLFQKGDRHLEDSGAVPVLRRVGDRG